MQWPWARKLSALLETLQLQQIREALKETLQSTASRGQLALNTMHSDAVPCPLAALV